MFCGLTQGRGRAFSFLDKIGNRRVAIVCGNQEPVNGHLMFAVGSLDALATGDAGGFADFKFDRTFFGRVAIDVNIDGGGREYDQVFRTGVDAYATADAEFGVNHRKAVAHFDSVERTGPRAAGETDTAEIAAFGAARDQRGGAAVADTVIRLSLIHI